MAGIDEPEMFNALRAQGLDADDAEIRAAVRSVCASVEELLERDGTYTARRCMEAMRAALGYLLQHPDTDDMSSFEADFEDDEG